MDGEHWEILSKQTNLSYTNQANTVEQAIANTKAFEVDNPSKVQFVKIVADRTNGNWFAARMFNFYEDKTVKTAVKFSFDGENAGKIILENEFENANWSYSIDDGITWKTARGKEYQLTNAEINQINEEDKIRVRFEGNVAECTVNIKTGEIPQITPYVNDWENRLIGLTNINTLEWKIVDSINGRTILADDWTDFSEEEPVVQGDKTLLVRTKGTGIYTPSEALEYEFTKDNQTDTAKYIPIKHLSIHDFSTQSIDSNRPHYAPNAIDGNINTEWHTDFRYSIAGTEAYIAIKLDEPKNISALEYLHMSNDRELYGYMKKGIVYVSNDGEEWTEVARIEDCIQDDEIKRITFNESVYGQYVKLVIESHDNIFATAAMINLYEDTTKNETPKPVIPTANVEYNMTEITNQSVTATIRFDKENVRITNNEGKNTYTFEENGEFTFEFEDKAGNKGTAVAKVDWIDKKAPVGTIEYSTEETTTGNVTATIRFDKENVRITNNEGKNTYTFEENGEFTFEFEDKAGNKGTAVAKVTWIEEKDDVAPTARVIYDIKGITNKNVTAMLIDESEEIVITNNGGKDTYTFMKNGEFTFEFEDQAGNKGTAKAEVDWIDKKVPVGTIEYSTRETTEGNVTAIISFDKENVRITNNGGRNRYTFEENGEFTFEFEDKAGNKGTSTAEVDWIKEEINNSTDTPNEEEKDNIAPTASIIYSTREITTESVMAMLVDESEDIIITNNNGNRIYIFTENGEFTFEFEDKAGNKGTAVAKVDWIREEVSKDDSSDTMKSDSSLNETVEDKEQKDSIFSGILPFTGTKKSPWLVWTIRILILAVFVFFVKMRHHDEKDN